MTPGWGLVVFDTAVNPDAITGQGGGTFDSNSSQTNPGPGLPVPADAASKWRPGITGAQSRDLTLTTVRGGYPSRRFNAARIIYRLATDTNAVDYRGWSPPNLVTGWSSPPSTWGSGAFVYTMGCVDPITGHLVVVGNTTTENGMTWSYEPRSETWTDGYDFGANQNLYGGFAAMMAHPDVPGRVLLFSGAGSLAATDDQVAYYSDDHGATWNVYARAYASDGLSAYARSVAGAPGVPWLLYDGAYLLSSSDAGQNWDRVSGQLSVTIDQKSFTSTVAARKGGGYVHAYVRAADGVPCVRLLPTAGHATENATEIEVDAAVGRDADYLSVCVDECGVIWMITVADNDPGRVRLYGSVDEGVTWSRFLWGPLAFEDVGYIDASFASLLASNGELYLIANAVGQTDGEVHLIRLGGWSTMESGSGGADDNRDVARVGYGVYDGASTDVERLGLFLPADYPENQGWTRTTGGGGGTRSFPSPGMTLACAAGADSDHYSMVAGGSYVTMSGEAIIALDGSAPNLGATAGTPATQAGITLTLADGVYTYTTQIEIGLDGLRVADGATSRATAAIDCSIKTYIRWHVTNTGKATVAYRQASTTGNTQFTRFANNVTITDGGATVSGDRVDWGNQAAGTQATTAVWYHFGATAGGAWHMGIDGAADFDLTIADGPRGLVFGHPAVVSPGYPIPDATAAGSDQGFLACTGGPTYVSEVVSAPVLWEASIANFHPAISPLPSAVWTADSVAAQTIAYDLGEPLWAGGAIALVALRARAKTITFQVDDGAGAWATAATLDLKLPVTTVSGVSTLYTTLVGRVVTPRTATGTIARFIHEGELVGGWMLVSTSGGDMYREITANSAGYWSTSSGVQRVRITLAGVDGTEDAAGTGEIYHHSGVMVDYPTTDTARQYRRVVVASMAGLLDHNGDAVVASAGILAPGRIVAPGAAANWNWTRRTEYTREVTRAADMTATIAKLGEPRQVWSYGWTDGLAWQYHRTLADAGEAVAASGGMPIGTEEDAWELLATVQRYMSSGEVPGVVLPALPATGGTITDPTLYLYGVLISDAVNITNVVGRDGVDEIVRMDVLSWEELR